MQTICNLITIQKIATNIVKTKSKTNTCLVYCKILQILIRQNTLLSLWTCIIKYSLLEITKHLLYFQNKFKYLYENYLIVKFKNRFFYFNFKQL